MIWIPEQRSTCSAGCSVKTFPNCERLSECILCKFLFETANIDFVALTISVEDPLLGYDVFQW